MEEVGLVLTVVILAFVIAVAILAFLLPIFVYNIRQTQKEMQFSVESIDVAIKEIAGKTSRQTEIMETDLKLKMIAKKAREAKPAT